MNMEKNKNKSGNEICSELGAGSKITVRAAIADNVSAFETVEVSFNTLPIQWLTEGITNALEATQFKELRDFINAETKAKNDEIKDMSISELVAASFKVAFIARLADVNEMKIAGGRANFEYCSVFGPFMAAYGRVVKPEIGLEIMPVPTAELIADGVRLGCLKQKVTKVAEYDEEGKCTSPEISEMNTEFAFKRGGQFIVPDWYREFMMFFRTYRILTNYGVPKDKFIEDDTVYQLTTVAEKLIGRQAIISPDVMLISAVIKAISMASIYGQYRVEYGTISSVRTALEDIALKCIHLNGDNTTRS